MTINCALAGRCGGCPWILQPYAEQLSAKKASFVETWRAAGLPDRDLGELTIHSLGEGGLRDRADMTIYREADGLRFGLYDLDRQHLVDIETCPQMTPALGRFFAHFRQYVPDMRLGSVRLRVAPDGRRGLWLHFPNDEIQRFLAEETWLTLWLKQAHVEVGQRRQTLLQGEAGLRLGAPQLKPWFETYLGESQRPVPLYCHVGSFTQPGFAANKALVALVMAMVRETGAANWLELGSGIGNFTLPLAAAVARVIALENDPRALDGLDRSAQAAGLKDRIQICRRNMHRTDPGNLELMKGIDGVLADPPRSGLRSFADLFSATAPADRPPHFIYVSCFARSLIQDAVRLYAAGYRVRALTGLDQFPQSTHCEWVLWFRRDQA